MAYRYWKPPIHNHGGIKQSQRPATSNNLKRLLEELHSEWPKIDVDPEKYANDKYYRFSKWSPSRLWNKKPPTQPKFRPCLCDDFRKFKKTFISEYDGEVVQETGMTHKEFWEYFTTGKREGVEMHSEEYWDSIPEDQWEWYC